jgi:hypothetical protein
MGAILFVLFFAVVPKLKERSQNVDREIRSINPYWFNDNK